MLGFRLIALWCFGIGLSSIVLLLFLVLLASGSVSLKDLDMKLLVTAWICDE